MIIYKRQRRAPPVSFDHPSPRTRSRLRPALVSVQPRSALWFSTTQVLFTLLPVERSCELGRDVFPIETTFVSRHETAMVDDRSDDDLIKLIDAPEIWLVRGASS